MRKGRASDRGRCLRSGRRRGDAPGEEGRGDEQARHARESELLGAPSVSAMGNGVQEGGRGLRCIGAEGGAELVELRFDEIGIHARVSAETELIVAGDEDARGGGRPSWSVREPNEPTPNPSPNPSAGEGL